MGNHDAFLIDEQLIRNYSDVPIVVDSVDWYRDRMTAADLGFVTSFETSFRVDLGPSRSAMLFHGSPRSHMEDLLATMDPDELDEALAGQKADVMAGGQTHIQMVRQHRGTLLVTPRQRRHALLRVCERMCPACDALRRIRGHRSVEERRSGQPEEGGRRQGEASRGSQSFLQPDLPSTREGLLVTTEIAEGGGQPGPGPGLCHSFFCAAASRSPKVPNELLRC